MQDFFAPNPMVLAFLALKKFGYIEIVWLLALVRVFAGRGLSRWLALIALLITSVGIASVFVPPLMNIWSGPVHDIAYRIANTAGGFGVIFAGSVALALSGIAPGRRWPVLDLLHFLLFAGFATMWWLYG